MSISRIVNPSFVNCIDCLYRSRRNDFRGRHRISYYWCDMHQHRLYSQRGCDDGSRRKRK